jgi:hypothetical protein
MSDIATKPPQVPPQEGSSIGWYIFIGLIVFFVIAIIVIVALNWNNLLDVKKSLPNYHIVYSAGNKYLNLINYTTPQAPENTLFNIKLNDGTPNPVWTPYLYLTDNSNGFSIWELENVTSTGFDDLLPTNKSRVRLINTVFNEETPGAEANPPINQGYITGILFNYNGGQYRALTSSGTLTNAITFTYTNLNNNEFTLDFMGFFLTAEEIPNYVTYTNDTKFKPMIFKLLPTTVLSNT